MNLGGNPVVKTGKLTMFDRSCDPVPVGHTLLLYGKNGSLELKAGASTNWSQRLNYPSFALISLNPRAVEFEQVYTSKDNFFRCNVKVEARVQVSDPRSYVSTFGDSSDIGSPFVDQWKRKLSNLVYQHGEEGPDKIQAELNSVRDSIESAKPDRNGVRLLECSFSLALDLVVTIAQTFQKQGPQAANFLELYFPEKAAAIRQWTDGFFKGRQAIRSDIESAAGMQLRIAESLRNSGIFDPDELRQFVKLEDLGEKAGLSSLLPVHPSTLALEKKPEQISGTTEKGSASN